MNVTQSLITTREKDQQLVFNFHSLITLLLLHCLITCMKLNDIIRHSATVEVFSGFWVKLWFPQHCQIKHALETKWMFRKTVTCHRTLWRNSLDYAIHWFHCIEAYYLKKWPFFYIPKHLPSSFGTSFGQQICTRIHSFYFIYFYVLRKFIWLPNYSWWL